MKKVNKIAMLLVISTLGATLTGCASFTSNIGSGSRELVSQGKKSFKAEEFESVQISTEAMEVVVTKSSGSDAEVELLVDSAIKEKFTFDAAIQSKVLELKVDEEGKITDKVFKDKVGARKLIISLPDKQYKQMTIQNEVGEVEATDLKVDSIKINLGIGSILLNGVMGEQNLEVQTGEIDVTGISLANNLTAKVSVGDVNIKLNEAPVAAQIKLHTELGEAESKLEQVEYSVNTTNEKVGTIGSEGPLVDLQASVGAVSIEAK